LDELSNIHKSVVVSLPCRFTWCLLPCL